MTNQDRITLAVHRPQLRAIEAEVLKFYGLTADQIRSRCRDYEVRHPRQVLQYQIRTRYPRIPLRIIGKITGNGKAFNHATIVNAKKTMDELVESKSPKGNYLNPDIRLEMDKLNLKINAALSAIKGANYGCLCRDKRHTYHRRAQAKRMRYLRRLLIKNT